MYVCIPVCINVNAKENGTAIIIRNCMYVIMYICMYVCMCVCIHVNIYIYIYIYRCIRLIIIAAANCYRFANPAEALGGFVAWKLGGLDF